MVNNGLITLRTLITEELLIDLAGAPGTYTTFPSNMYNCIQNQVQYTFNGKLVRTSYDERELLRKLFYNMSRLERLICLLELFEILNSADSLGTDIEYLQGLINLAMYFD